MANRGRREALVLVALLTGAVLVFGAVHAFVGGGDAERTSTPQALEQMQTAPKPRWTTDAATLFGAAFDGAQLSVEAAGDLVIVKASPSAMGRQSALIAVDPDTGQPRWKGPRIGWDGPCAMSRDHRLACTSTVREGGAVVNRVSFIDPRSGEDVATDTVRIAGYSSIARAGDGYLVVTTEMKDAGAPGDLAGSTGEVRTEILTGDEIPDQPVTVTRYDSLGHRSWAITPPVNHTEIAVSEAGNLLAASGRLRGGFVVYRLDSGRSLFSVPQRARGAARGDTKTGDPDTAVLTRSGFATSRSTMGAERIEFFDPHGARTGELPGWRLAPDQTFSRPVIGVEDDALPVVTSFDIGIVSARDRALRWKATSAPSALEVFDDGYAAKTRDDDQSPPSQERMAWTLVDVRTGAQRGTFTTGFGQRLVGFDGGRLIFEGEAAADEQPNRPSLTAYDARTGAESWRLPPPSGTGRWQHVAPYLFLLDGTGDNRTSLTRYAS